MRGSLKNQKLFIYSEAFAKVVKEFPNLRLKIVGKEFRISIEKKTEEYGVAHLVDLEGFQNDVIPFYLYAKATLLTHIRRFS